MSWERILLPSVVLFALGFCGTWTLSDMRQHNGASVRPVVILPPAMVQEWQSPQAGAVPVPRRLAKGFDI